MPKVPRGGYLKKVLLIITDGLTKELCIGAYPFSRSVIRIGRKAGFEHKQKFRRIFGYDVKTYSLESPIYKVRPKIRQ